MKPALKDWQFKSTKFIISGSTILENGEVFDELIIGKVNEYGENLHYRKVGDGITKYSKLPKEEFYDKFNFDESYIDL